MEIGSGNETAKEHAASTRRSEALSSSSSSGTSDVAETEPLLSMTKRAADFIAISFRSRIENLSRAAKARSSYEGEYAPAVRYFADACDAARAVLQKRLDALDQIVSGTQAASAETEQKNDHGAGLIHQTIPDVEGTEPRPIFRLGDRVAVQGRVGVYEGEHPIHGGALIRFDGDGGQSLVPIADVTTLVPAPDRM